MKCQERNSLLVQMMRFMRRQGCEEPSLAQQVEQLVSDATLQDYAVAFSPGRQTQDYTPEFISKLQHQICAKIPSLTTQQDQNKFTAQPGVKCGELESEKQTCSDASESTTNNKGFTGEITSVPTETAMKDSNLFIPISPVPESARVHGMQSPVLPVLNEGVIITEQVSTDIFLYIWMISFKLFWPRCCTFNVLTTSSHYCVEWKYAADAENYCRFWKK